MTDVSHRAPGPGLFMMVFGAPSGPPKRPYLSRGVGPHLRPHFMAGAPGGQATFVGLLAGDVSLRPIAYDALFLTSKSIPFLTHRAPLRLLRLSYLKSMAPWGVHNYSIISTKISRENFSFWN